MPLSKKYRLSKEREIKNVFSKGRTLKGGFFLIRFLENNLAHSRVAVIVSKKVSNKATQRNLVKRRTYSAIERECLLKNGFDILVVVLPPIVGKRFQEIKTEIDRTIKKVFV